MEDSSDFKKVLVFSAHPDDLDFGCAGTVAKMISEGKEITYCIITNGEKGTHNVNVSNDDMALMREKEQKEAARVVGVQNVIFLGEIDGTLENTENVQRKIVRAIRQEKPDIIISFDPANLNFDSFYLFHRDHRMAAEAVFDSVYPAAGSDAFFPELIDEGLIPHQIKGMMFFGTAHSNMLIDITGTIGKKIEALKKHVGQFKDMGAMEERVRERAREEGKKIGIEYAESFRKLTF